MAAEAWRKKSSPCIYTRIYRFNVAEEERKTRRAEMEVDADQRSDRKQNTEDDSRIYVTANL